MEIKNTFFARWRFFAGILLLAVSLACLVTYFITCNGWYFVGGFAGILSATLLIVSSLEEKREC